ncbi:MAG: peptidylprolyl isomerase [Oscillospiraceae bacterium]|nr:peptidylprolyl isomerase [Oscillospiraceae bacterium]
MKKTLAILLLFLFLAACAVRQPLNPPPQDPLLIEATLSPAEEAARNNAAISESSVKIIQFDEPRPGDLIAVINTTAGEIRARLFMEHAPKTVAAFTKLADGGFYNGQSFHTVVEGYKIECGVTGADDSPFPDEREFSLELWNFRGALSLTNNGADFMIVHAPRCLNPASELTELNFPGKVVDMYIDAGGAPHQDWENPVFGAVIEGMEVVDKIASLPTNEDGAPEEPAVITEIQIITAE